jgi:hypothetical protein
MTGDFPDRDEWTDKPDPPVGSCDCCGKDGAISRVTAYGIETYVCHRCQGMSDESAEWSALGDTDLISTEELADVVRPKGEADGM